MTKSVQGETLEARTYTPYSQWSFYRPHDRARTAYTGRRIDRFTGEVLPPLPSRTKQEFKDQCDINNIIKAFKITGQITHISAQAAKGAYMDLPDEVDFQTSLNVIRQAEESFATLPAAIRDRFGNDPAAFLAFMSDPKNREEADRLGLLKKPEPGPAGPPNSPPPPPPPAAPPPAPEPPK